MGSQVDRATNIILILEEKWKKPYHQEILKIKKKKKVQPCHQEEQFQVLVKGNHQMGFQVNSIKDRIQRITRSGSQNNQVVYGFDHWFLVEGDCCKDKVSDQPSFEKIIIESFVLFIFPKLNMQSLCSVSIVKERPSVVTYFWILTLKRRKYKKYIQKKPKNNSSEKKMLKRSENGQKLVDEV